MNMIYQFMRTCTPMIKKQKRTGLQQQNSFVLTKAGKLKILLHFHWSQVLQSLHTPAFGLVLFFLLNNRICPNNYIDVTHDETAALICGYTEKQVKELLDIIGCSNTYDQIREYYDGYSFSYQDTDLKVFNPFSINRFAITKSQFVFLVTTLEIEPYWGRTGTTGRLFMGSDQTKAKMLHILNSALDNGNCTIRIGTNPLESNYEPKEVYELYPELLALQSGLITIKKKVGDTVVLGAPNDEVKDIVEDTLIKQYMGRLPENIKFQALSEALEKSDLKAYMETLAELIKDIIAATKYVDISRMCERSFYPIILAIQKNLKSSANYYVSEVANIGGRADYYLITREQLWIFEYAHHDSKKNVEEKKRQIKGEYVSRCLDYAYNGYTKTKSSYKPSELPTNDDETATQRKNLVKGIKKITRIGVRFGNKMDRVIENWVSDSEETTYEKASSLQQEITEFRMKII
eukprot:TRINITY_DN1908_c0_g2_i1.p1 TRINITY_DN1908_c0_g2~~TRINITY_DN1908_c0_g2_i1.p1  ORF type:complete len:462 (+),score=42.24 TRINITY_DN1908_c0_g2_i1:1042-2427(+)